MARQADVEKICGWLLRSGPMIDVQLAGRFDTHKFKENDVPKLMDRII